MDVTPLVKTGQQIIQSYSSGGFKISGQVYEHPVLIFPDHTQKWDVANAPQNLNKKDFEQLINYQDQIDVVLLGCGSDHIFISPTFRRELKDEGLSVEPMNTGAACRTYNVLMAEGRRVVAALFPLS